MGIPEHDPAIPRTTIDDISSRDHHYIPKFYFKGFSDSEGMLYLYDKQTKRIRGTAPGGAFYQKHGNTGNIQHPMTGEKHWTDLAERLFSGLESQMVTALDILKMTNAGFRATDSAAVVDTIKSLIQFLFWRTPANRERLEQVIDLISLPELGLQCVDDQGNRLEEVEELMKTIDLWRKFSPALLAAGREFSRFACRNQTDWDILYEKNGFSFVTDNPILLRDYEDPSSLESNLLFPLTGDMLVLAHSGTKRKRMPAEVREELDVLLFHQADRYVASASKEYLVRICEKAVRFSFRGDRWQERLKQEVFNAFIE